MPAPGCICASWVAHLLGPPPSGTLENLMLARKVLETPEAV